MYKHTRGIRGMLEEVFDLGSTTITAVELKRLCNRTTAQRITKGVWREVSEAWSDLLARENSDATLIIGDNIGSYSFIYSDGLDVSGSNYWFEIKSLADSED